MAHQYELNLRDYWMVVRKRKWIILSTVVLVAISTLAVTEFTVSEKVYEASARVKFDRSTTLPGLMADLIAVSEGNSISTQTEVIRGVPVLLRVARDLGRVGPEVDYKEARRSPEVLAKVYALKERVAVAQEGTTNILKITATDEDAESAARLANAVAEAYRNENINSRNRQVDDAKLFVEEQLKAVEEKYRQSEQALLRFKEREGNVFLTEEAREALMTYSRLEAEREKLAQIRREAANQLKLLRTNETLPEPGPVRVFSDDVQALIAKLNQRLVDLTTERAALLINYTPKHPQVLELDGRIQSVKQEMVKELDAKLQTFSERENAIQESIGRYKERYINLPKAALELASLERDVKVGGDLYAALKQKHQEFLVRGAERIEEVSIIEPALPPGAPKNAPKGEVNFALGALIGMLLGVVLAFVRESFDTSIGTIEDVEEFLKVPVLGVIPRVDEKEVEQTIRKVFPETIDRETLTLLSRISPLFDLKGIIAEGYRSLKVNLQFACLNRTVKSLAFASAGLGEGKTTTVLNLAITIAQDGRRVLLVDADLRKPAIHSRLGIRREPGLSDVLMGTAQWQDVVQTATDLMLGKLGFDQILSAPGVDNLSVITSGLLPPNPSEFFNSQRFADLMDALEESYDLVILDCPPILPVADAVLIGPRVDGVVLVYQVGRVGRTPLQRAKSLLDNAHASLIGVVLSNVSAEYSPDYYHEHYYKYSS
ncbi:MAG TPA: polysaccharide biosynthesis tyrosine autokinase [Nitrospirales bacterium]|jgi:capsular exopolysaccharide synthesis family protein|nr:polysaccharide biosynthesis tyrosine autokinase [Nitrospirales bacterium]